MMPYFEQPPNKWRRQGSGRISWKEDDVQILRTRESIKKRMRNCTQYHGKTVICELSEEEMRQTHVNFFNYIWGKQNQFVNQFTISDGFGDIKKYRKYRKLSKKSYEDAVIESKQSHHARRKFLREKNMHKGNKVCAICMSNMYMKVVYVTKCKHTFCKSCFDSLREHNSDTEHTLKCPMCRGKVSN